MKPTIETGELLLYENYKEPLKTVKEALGEGYGYMGTVATSHDRELVQCHVCGDLFESVGGHVRTHGMKVSDYKKRYGLDATVALIGESLRKRMILSHVHKLGQGLPKHLEGYNEKFRSGELKRKGHSPSLQWRNRMGLCPDQVLEKISELKEKLGRVPSYDEFGEHYKHRYMGAIEFQHGSYSNAVMKLGFETRGQMRAVTEEKLIRELQDFWALHSRIPMTSDFNRGMLRNKAAYIIKFGSLNEARVAAGLNALVALSRGKFVELTPQEYMAYKDGHKKVVEDKKPTYGINS